jgi:hypothetical protein
MTTFRLLTIHLASLVTVALAVASAASPPVLPVTSNFDSGLEGWTSNTPAEVSWAASGGNPGGYARFVDESQNGTGLLAPAEYFGDWSTLDRRAVIRLDHKIFQGAGPFARYQARLTGTNGSAQWVGDLPTGPTEWVSLELPITECAWTLLSGTWAELLNNVTEVRLEIELGFGADVSGIDNIVFESACAADIAPANGDGEVNVDDLIAVILAWGPCPPTPNTCPANIACSGAIGPSVDVDDLIAVILAWGPCD